MFTGQGLFYTIILLVAAVCVLPALLSYHKLARCRFVLGLLAAFGIAVTPFILTLLMGSGTAVRSQFTYALAAVFLLLFTAQTLLLKKPAFRLTRWAAAALLLVFTVTQISTVRFIWTAHEYVAEYDRETATDIMKIMYDSFIVDTGVAGCMFWGSLQPESPYADAISGSPSYLFTSVFNLEHHIEPYCFYSTNRILGYMEAMGHRFIYPTNRTRTVSAYIMSIDDIPAFPDRNCSHNDFEAFTFNLGNSEDYYY